MSRTTGQLRRRFLLLGLLLAALVGLVVPLGRGRAGGRASAGPLLASDAALSAGAARVAIAVPFPVRAVGYGTIRPEVDHAVAPVEARALVLVSGGVRVGLVTLDVLFADEGLVAAVREASARLGLSTVWVAATHAHSSLGGYARSPVAQVAATGWYRPEVRRRLVDAAARALRDAEAAARPVTAFAGESVVPALTGSRDEVPDVDVRLTRLSFLQTGAARAGPGTSGAPAGAVGQLVVFACHPTLVPRPPSGLDPDWPGRLARSQETAGHGVTLVLQGSVANASAAPWPGTGAARLEGFVEALSAAASRVPLRELRSGLAVRTATVTLPGVDARRLVPRWAGPATENLALAPWAPSRAELSVLRVGDVGLLAVPAETSAASGEALEQAAGASRTLDLVDGYLGYVEPAPRVEQGGGESRRQLFGPALLETLVAGARALSPEGGRTATAAP